MLKLAYAYKDKLNEVYQKIIFNKKYKYYNYGVYWNYNITVEDNSWGKIQMVSMDSKDNILGYFIANIDRNSNKVDSLGVMNFEEKDNIVFSKDLYKFIIKVFVKFNIRKIEFCVVIGNPIQKMYDKYINKYGGRVIGIKKKAVKLDDGNYYDEKHYEIFREDFIYSFQRIHRCKSISDKINKL